ncbi:uncharacterized protein LTR77_006294 [Saxophila tyrrhenica]|uniref:Transcription factor IIIC 90kDa subunit N-terminal domain-containing protein n=1 Tax=Saxophila tyrrhenica TaxID=1690608 RepID=A0AAV9PBR6_9PEZI|nr:hypothetical protein LTR77_006294 [Saxophila tyrrhenica]
MTGRFELKFWPATTNCISWSKDNLIAVAGSDSIAILTPRPKDAGINGTHWDKTIITVNAFTVEEVPLSDFALLLSFKNFSVAEEQSHRTVQALAWSDPGIGKYGRSVLAVLSSNHILSLWECSGRLSNDADWKRSVIVNHALRKHYASLPNRKNETDKQYSERQQVSQRVRAFTWAAPPDKGQPSDKTASFLAVSTEAEEIVVLKVTSPYNILNPDVREWRVDVTGSFSSASSAVDQLRAHVYNTDGVDDSTRALAEATRIADHIAWGLGKGDEQSATQSKLAFISNGRLYCVTPGKRTRDGATDRHRLLPNRSDLTGPLKFLPHTEYLIVFGADTVFCVDTAADPTSPASSTSHHLDGRWDGISGMALSAVGSDAPRIHLASMLSSSSAPTTVLHLPLNASETSSKPAWQTALVKLKKAFGKQHKLGNNVLDRVWGLAASPMGDLVVTATVLLPSNAISYLVPSEHRSKISMTREQQADSVLPACGEQTRRHITSATLLSSLHAYVKQATEATESDTLIKAMLEVIAAPAEVNGTAADNDTTSPRSSPAECVRFLRLPLTNTPEVREARCRLLADIALKQPYNINHIVQLVVKHLVAEVLKIPAVYGQAGELSRKIHFLYNLLSFRLRLHSNESSDGDDVPAFREECVICNEAIPFESIKWARCDGGHRFDRCGLTFLAIHAPGISKSCSICATAFFDEWSLLAIAQKADEDVVVTEVEGEQSLLGNQEGTQNDEARSTQQSSGTEPGDQSWVEVSQPSTEPAESLARILFAAFDKCVYCGGDF